MPDWKKFALTEGLFQGTQERPGLVRFALPKKAVVCNRDRVLLQKSRLCTMIDNSISRRSDFDLTFCFRSMIGQRTFANTSPQRKLSRLQVLTSRADPSGGWPRISFAVAWTRVSKFWSSCKKVDSN